jgi:hypothetical protein
VTIRRVNRRTRSVSRMGAFGNADRDLSTLLLAPAGLQRRVAHGRQQRLTPERLRDQLSGAQFARDSQWSRARIVELRGHRDQRGSRPSGPDQSEPLAATPARHVDVRDHKVRSRTGDGIAARECANLMACRFEPFHEEPPHQVILFHKNNTQHAGFQQQALQARSLRSFERRLTSSPFRTRPVRLQVQPASSQARAPPAPCPSAALRRGPRNDSPRHAL